MSDQKKPFYKNYLVIILFGIIFSWFLIYYVWASYPSRIIKDDTVNSKDLPANIWKGIPYLPPKEKEIEGNSYYSALGSTYGTYGDMYGSLNTLFSGLAFATLIISLLLQMLELRETRKELANQSKALLDQKTEFSAQTKILEKQADINANQQKIIDAQFKETQKINFLNHFYKLIDEKNLLLNNLTMPNGENTISGHSVFSACLPTFIKVTKNYDPTKHNKDYFSENWKEFIIEKYGSINYQITSYFKIYRIILHTIHTSKSITDSEKKYYIDAFRMFTSLEELTVLMWISISDKKLNLLCNQFSLLSGLYHKNIEETGANFFQYEAFKTKTWEDIFKKYKKG
ncbi:putative phage abortive infection protein [Acinetobacter baumannii]|uniref:putative phage abortive infection protein n=1 Tax=Acinetobacter baumannii TaxID=470 RepID=UPI003B42F81B